MSQGIPRNQIKTRATIAQAEHEDDLDARRVVIIDDQGNIIGQDNPLPIDFDSAITISDVTIADDDGDKLQINPDGSINVVATTGQGTVLSIFNEVSAVPSNTLTTIATYTVPAGDSYFLQKAEASGTNLATYTVQINGVNVDKKRTNFGTELGVKFDFSGAPAGQGVVLNPGDVVRVQVTHPRLSVGDFESRIQVLRILV